MRFYIVDDDEGVVRILTNIVEEYDLGEVIGSAFDGETARREILQYSPDIVMADLLMPKLDGNRLVADVKALKPKVSFIMLSQVSDPHLIGEAYMAGIEFFISKPINKIAVERVTKKVVERIEMETVLRDIRKVLIDNTPVKGGGRDSMKEIKYTLSSLGMLGEKGTNDILKICGFLIERQKTYEDCQPAEISILLGDNIKTIRQRMRRSIKCGLTNLAHTGLDDHYNDSFQRYSSILFEFESVKAEMDHLRGKRHAGGKVNIDKFLEGLMLQCE